MSCFLFVSLNRQPLRRQFEQLGVNLPDSPSSGPCWDRKRSPAAAWSLCRPFLRCEELVVAVEWRGRRKAERYLTSTFPARNPVPRRHSIVCAIKYLQHRGISNTFQILYFLASCLHLLVNLRSAMIIERLTSVPWYRSIHSRLR